MRKLLLSLGFILLAMPLVANATVCELAELDSLALNGNLGRPDLLNTVAFAPAGSAGLARIDISDPENLVSLGLTATQDEALDLVLEYFHDLVVVADGDAGVSVYSAGQGGVLTHQGTVDLGDRITAVTGISSEFLAGSADGTLYTVVLGVDSVPSSQGSVELGGTVHGVIQQFNNAYVALGDGGLALVDVSDRTSPVMVNHIDLGGPVLAVARDNNVLYCSVGGLGVVSVLVQGTQLSLQASLALSEAPTGLVARPGRILMAVPGDGVLLADTSVGSDLLVISQLALVGATGIATSGSVLYVSRGSNGFSTVDTSGCTGTVQVTSYYVSAGARVTGFENTFWVTDLALANFSPGTVVCNIAYLAKNQNNTTPLSSTFTIESGEQLMLADIFGTTFQLEEADGGLRITTSHPDVKASSRTYNAAGEVGTYGQYIPALGLSEALSPGVTAVILQLEEDADFRSNIGLLNRTPIDGVQVKVDFYDASGVKLGSRIEELMPYEMVQFNIRHHTGPVQSAYAVLDVLTEDARVFAYASVIDNGSGDPVFMLPQTLLTGAIF